MGIEEIRNEINKSTLHLAYEESQYKLTVLNRIDNAQCSVYRSGPDNVWENIHNKVTGLSDDVRLFIFNQYIEEKYLEENEKQSKYLSGNML